MCRTANTPTVTKASNLTTDSKAMASITPSWCSVASRRRVPKSMAKIAISRATQSAVSANQAGGPDGGAGQHVDAGADRLVLQREIRHRGGERHHGNQRSQRRALAESRRNQVGDRRRVARARDRDQSLQERRREQEYQGRAEVDGQVGPAVPHGRADRPEESPRRAVDPEREAVDVRAQPRPARVDRPAFAVESDGEEQPRYPIDSRVSSSPGTT